MKKEKIPIVLNRGEMKRLIAAPVSDQADHLNPHQKFNAIRNEAIIRLAFSTGLRVQEICNLNTDSLFPEEKQLKVRMGKFGNEDYQPFTKPETWEALNRYLIRREKIDHKGSALFISFYGQRILARQINRYLKDYARKAGIKKNVHAHTLRHSAASILYRKRRDLLVVQKFLRHKNIASTIIYTHICKDDLADALREVDL